MANSGALLELVDDLIKMRNFNRHLMPWVVFGASPA
jgi:hypothetical protein